jgi:hypothetical protein
MAGRGLPWVTIAVSGQAFSSLDDSLSMRARDLHASFDRTVVVLVGGTSDLIEGDTAAQVLTDFEAYAAAHRALGADAVVATTVTPSTLLNATAEARRVEVNALILASDAFDRVVDVAGLENLAVSDGTHWTAASAQRVADLVGPTLDDVLT